DDVDAARREFLGERDRVLDRPAAFDIVDRRHADKKRFLLRPAFTHRAHHLQRKAHALLARAAVRDGREKAVQQVAVCGVDLEHLEARGMSAAYRGAIGSEQRFLVARADRPWAEPAFAERLARGANDIPGFFAAL